MATKLTRFGVSLEEDLLGNFDSLIDKQGYGNRSEALRDLIREALRQEQTVRAAGAQVGVLALVFDHHKPGLQNNLTRIFHDHTANTVASMHIHITHRLCLEVVTIRGKAGDLRRLAAEVRAIKGVLLGDLFLVPAGGK